MADVLAIGPRVAGAAGGGRSRADAGNRVTAIVTVRDELELIVARFHNDLENPCPFRAGPGRRVIGHGFDLVAGRARPILAGILTAGVGDGAAAREQ